ncbi:MAG: mercury(II) reductase [Deltaproteobacteria bacterium]|nr:mercury(II) reductase [Deltaproteobacteria bacterium]
MLTETTKKLIIIGGGSAAFAAALRASDLGDQVTMINDGLPIGGTCVNVGCIPSKTLLRAAEAYHRTLHHNFSGIEADRGLVNFQAVIRKKRQMVEDLRQEKYLNVIQLIPNIQFIEGRGYMAAPDRVTVNGEEFKGDNILIATGARPLLASVPGLSEIGYLTNETAFELEELPESLIVLGGRSIALECAQMFARFGSRVTILQRSTRILPSEEPDITDSLSSYFREEGIEIATGVTIGLIRKEGDQVVVETTVGGAPKIFKADHVLAATGRKANTEGLGLEKVGVELNSQGFLKVDETLKTSVSSIYGAGDVIGEPMFVYTAAYEGALAAENALSGSSKVRDYSILPWVIFTDPQVAGVGLDEAQARQQGIDAEVASLPLSQVPRSLAARDTRGFIKLIRDRQTDRLIGARILAPEGSELLMEISLALKFGLTAQETASFFHPYLTLSEGVKLAAIMFKKDLNKLSCCAI